MRIAVLLCILLVLGVTAACIAQDAPDQEGPEKPGKKRSAGASGMAYGSVLLSVLMMIALPAVALLLITKLVGIPEVGLIRCVYTSLIFFAVVALVFYKAEGLEEAIANPVKFFEVTGLLIRLGIAFGVAFILVEFVLSGRLVRSLIGALLYILGFYGATYLAYGLMLKADALDMLKGGLGG